MTVRMTHVLIVKILFTILAWALPMLLAPSALFALLGMPVPDPLLFLRMLGIAFLALLVVYIDGFRKARRGEFPFVTVLAGIVSNGGISALLLYSGVTGLWSQWGCAAQVFMWGSAVVAAIITIGFAIGRADEPTNSASTIDIPSSGTHQ